MKKYFTFLLILLLLQSCKKTDATLNTQELITEYPKNIEIPENMVWVKGAFFNQGAKEIDSFALPHEKPLHQVGVDGFFIDETEVTNAQFKKFIDATGYVTIAERPVIWEEMKKTLPANTPKPHDSLLVPGSLVFFEGVKEVNGLNDYQQWWKWTAGANWRHPYGKNSNIIGKDNFPVVHVTYLDALAYCKWANRALPTEAQWELAAMGKTPNAIYTWGNNRTQIAKKANTWNGTFPTKNTKTDGYVLMAPVKSFPANTLGIYEMSGNLWEYTADFYNSNYYDELHNTKKVTINPKGADKAFNPNNPYQSERIIKGGSFLCNEDYCSSFRISARMGMTEDSSSDHVGFRTIATIEMLEKK
jgi:formylglycine-generating enzyme